MVIGLCEYAFVSGESGYFEHALALYDNVSQRLASGGYEVSRIPRRRGLNPMPMK